MKITGRCPQCATSDVHVITMDWPRLGADIPVGVFAHAKVDHYVCGHCGYIESYVSDPDDIANIAEKWPRIQR